MTDALGHVTNFEYDELGQLLRETDSSGKITAYAYDANRNLASRTDPNGNIVTFTYDALDRLVKKRYLATRLIMPMINSAIWPRSRIRWRALVMVTTWLAGWLVCKEAGKSRPRSTQYFRGYDRNSLNLNAGPTTSIRNYSHDSLHRILSIETLLEGIYGQARFSYDALGRRNQTNYNWLTPGVTNFIYDDASRLTRMDAGGYPGAIDYTYDAAGIWHDRFALTAPPACQPRLTMQP